MTLDTRLEAILFVASKPLSRKKLIKTLDVSLEELDAAFLRLAERYSGDDAGIHFISNDEQVQLLSNPACEDVVTQFIKSDTHGDLTKAQLETLTVIAYRGPVSRQEIEQIRGVNCSVILRNLLVRGLIGEEKKEGSILEYYRLSVQAMSILGISSVTELANYDTLHAHDYVEQLLAEKKAEAEKDAVVVEQEEAEAFEESEEEEVSEEEVV